jgi:DNA-binding LytR/AlgR family response regulator
MKGAQVKVFIVEDEPLIAADLEMNLQDLGYEVCGQADNAMDAIADMAVNKPDLVLLDISIEGDLDGIQLAAKINEKFQIPFIYITSHADKGTIERVKQTKPAGFILKPFDEGDLRSNIEIALFRYGTDVPVTRPDQEDAQEEGSEFVIADSIFIKDKGRLIKVPFKDILYCEAFDNYTKLYALGQKFLISTTLKSVESRLGGGAFLRVHRSYVINVAQVKALEDGYVFIEDQTIPVGKTHKEELMKRINTL